MDKQYPVVDERVLAPVPPKRFFSRGTPGRTPDEVPVPLAGHRLVYRIRGEYVLDTGTLTLDSPTVVDASFVSVVDVTTNTKVAVELAIPSRDGSYFTIRVTFLCTVDDPVVVLRTGGHDAEAMISGYLRGHQRIFEMGLDFDLDAINEVRRKLSAQIRAYVTLSPPSFAGMAAELASVEVSTPEEVAKFRETLREQKLTQVVKTKQLTNQQRLGDIEDIHKRLREVQDSEHVRALDGAQREHVRSELKLTADAVASDPFAALALAYSAGELNAKEFADELKRLREQEIAQDREDLRARIEYDREQTRLKWEAEREDHRRELEARYRATDQNREFDHEQARAQWEAERIDRSRRAEWEREDRQLERQAYTREIDENRHFDHEQARAKWEAERSDHMRRAEWQREDRRLEREETAREIEAKLEVIRELAKHGHMDTMNLRLDKFVNDMLGPRSGPSIDRGKDEDTPAIAPAITQAEQAPEPADDERADSAADEDQNTKVEA